MLEGQNIICFAKDWSEDPTSNNHVMRLLASDNRVLWLNSIATRTPNARRAARLQKIGRKLKSFVGRAGARRERARRVHADRAAVPALAGGGRAQSRHPAGDAVDASPPARHEGLPAVDVHPHGGRLRRQARRVVRRLLLHRRVVALLATSTATKIVAMEKELCGSADIVFATRARWLEREAARTTRRRTSRRTASITTHFAKALWPGDDDRRRDRAVAEAGASGFIGLVQDWVDLDLIG